MSWLGHNGCIPTTNPGNPEGAGLPTLSPGRTKERVGNVRASASATLLAHPLCSTEEFGYLVRRAPRVVSRKVRAGEILGHGRPTLIHAKEAAKFGLSLEDARELLIAMRTEKRLRAVA